MYYRSMQCEQCGALARIEVTSCDSCGGNSWRTMGSSQPHSMKLSSLVAVATGILAALVWVLLRR